MKTIQVKLKEITLYMDGEKFEGVTPFEGVKVSNPEIASAIFRQFVGEEIEVREVFVVLFLNTAMMPIGIWKAFTGAPAYCHVDFKLITATALACNASSLICFHNHPSGNPTPSDADEQLTKDLKKALKLFKITLDDHLVVTEKSHTSITNYFSI